MMHDSRCRVSMVLAIVLTASKPVGAQGPPAIARFAFDSGGLVLDAPARRGRFFSVAGRRAAVFGYENLGLEGWVYPLEVVEDFRLSFRLEGYPLEIEGGDSLVGTSARPEATVFVYSHAAFTVRQVLFVPVDESAVVVLLEIDTVLPMTVTARFRPRLRPMWPAGLMTPNVDWDGGRGAYRVSEESRRFVGVVGSPGAKDVSLMPYQEEPRDAPLRFEVAVSPERARRELVPVVIAASTRASPRIPTSARDSSPGFGPRATASGPASRGSSAETRSGPPSPPPRTATSGRHASRSSSCAASSARTARSPTRSRRARPSCRGSRATRTRGTAPTRPRSTWSPTATTSAPRATGPSWRPPGPRS